MRRPKSAKSKEAKPSVARKSPKNDGAKGRDLEKRLADALGQLQTSHREHEEALEQQTATSEILRVIASSPMDVLPTFEAIAAAATRLCAAQESGVVRFDGALMHLIANDGFTPKERDVLRAQFPRPATRGMVTGRAIVTRAVAHIADITRDPEYDVTALQHGRFIRTVLSVPMLHNGQPVGAITVTRREAQPFSASQITLLQTFADQAVIAIENVRLFKELQEKNRALTQALDQQTATSEILRVIARSPTDVQPVFDTIVRRSLSLCDATLSGVGLVKGDEITLGAARGLEPEAMAVLRGSYPRPLSRDLATSRAVLERRVIHIPDVQADREYSHPLARDFGVRTALAVPMLREGVPIGAIACGEMR
jgi:GAF domain-containing protein